MTEDERLAKALVNSHGYTDSKGAWRVVRNEDAEQAAALLRSQARYIKDMEDTISTIAGIVGTKDTDAAIEAVRSQAAEIEALKQTLHDELDANLRLRELGGARSDEPMTTFLERVFAERYALRALCIDYSIACGELSKGLSEDDPMWSQLKSLGERIDAAIDAARQS